MAWRPAAALAAAGLVLAGSASGAARKAEALAPCPTTGTQATSFTRAVSGNSFIAGDGSEVSLAGILSAGSDGQGQPSAEIRNALETRLAGKSLSLAFAVPARDRYGRWVAQVFADGTWVQGDLLRAGLARASPDIATAACAASALAAEAFGRRARAGGWGSGAFEIATPDGLVAAAKRKAGSFQIVEGTVTTATVVGGRAYLNFGADRKTDFTVTISPDDMKGFRRAKFDPKALAGRRVRVRGWVELYNGPEFEIATPGAIERLE